MSPLIFEIKSEKKKNAKEGNPLQESAKKKVHAMKMRVGANVNASLLAMKVGLKVDIPETKDMRNLEPINLTEGTPETNHEGEAGIEAPNPAEDLGIPNPAAVGRDLAEAFLLEKNPIPLKTKL